MKASAMATNVCLSCDSVFDILTRGPYPTGEGQSNSDVDQHLAACHDCRQLAEALRPATQLFHEVITTESVAGLPVFRADLPVLKPALSTPTKPLWQTISVAACLVFFGCAAGFTLRHFQPTPTPVVSTPNNSDTFDSIPLTLNALNALPIEDRCARKTVFTQHPPETSENVFDCCTRCHRSTGEEASTGRTTIIASSCLACHAAPKS